MLMSKDIKQSSAMLRRNMRHVRTWLEEQGAAAECVAAAPPVLVCYTCMHSCCMLSTSHARGSSSAAVPASPSLPLPARRQAAKQDIKQVAEHKPPPPGEGSKPDAPKQP